MMRINDTIAAVSTPRGKGGIAVIRISGANAVEIAEKIFEPISGKKLSETGGGRAVYGKIYEAGRRDVPIDDGVALVFLAPHSFSGEDTVEINCHGGILVTETVLSAVFAAGARPAEAGEFTRRAFVNGRIGLSEAEALSNLLEAKSYSQLKLARAGVDGRLEKKCDEVYSSLKTILASLYAKIDYPDEDLADISSDEMCKKMTVLLEDVKKILSTYRSGRAIAEGIKTAICGRPNVGKSSLYNCIVGRNAAIVTDMEGTTRDVLEETATLGDVTLRLCDTAGLHSSEDHIEQIGMERAYGKIDEAELILAVFDGSSELCDDDERLINYLADKSEYVIAVVNKCDAVQKADRKKLEAAFETVVEISARNGSIEELVSAVRKMFLDEKLNIETDPVVFGARQNAALTKTADYLAEAVNILVNGGEVDAAAFAAETAMSAISELDGRSVGDEIVSQIFAKFCVGK